MRNFLAQFSLSLKVVKKLSVIEIKQTFIFIISGNLLTLKSAPTFVGKFLNENKTSGGQFQVWGLFKFEL